jgi:hypothetical protein
MEKLLWFGGGWEGIGMKEALGTGWLEFIHPDDFEGFMAWRINPKPAASKFRVLFRTGWACVAMTRRRAGDCWLVITELQNCEVTDPEICRCCKAGCTKNPIYGSNTP